MLTYTLDGILGRGGAGTVYRARMAGSGGFAKTVAVKLLRERCHSPEQLRLLQDEARLLGLCRDRAFVTAEPPIQVDDGWAVVMEYVPGASAHRLLHTLGPLPVSVVLHTTQELARCMDSAYHLPTPSGAPLQLVHRDIKPSNILLTAAGTVKLIDLGIATAAVDLRCVDPPGCVIGSKSYMPPERIERREGPESDVFSLGTTMRRLATADRPMGFGYWTLTHRVDHEQPFLSELIELSTACQQADPADRPTMREVEGECQRLLHRFNAPPLRDWCERAVPRTGMGLIPTPEPLQLRCIDAENNRYTLEKGGNTESWWRRLVKRSS